MGNDEAWAKSQTSFRTARGSWRHTALKRQYFAVFVVIYFSRQYKHRGRTNWVLEGRGGYFCLTCQQNRVIAKIASSLLRHDSTHTSGGSHPWLWNRFVYESYRRLF